MADHAFGESLQDLLPNVIRPSQMGLVEGRSILDNTFLA